MCFVPWAGPVKYFSLFSISYISWYSVFMATEPQQNEEVLERFIFSLVPSHLSTSSRAHSPFLPCKLRLPAQELKSIICCYYLIRCGVFSLFLPYLCWTATRPSSWNRPFGLSISSCWSWCSPRLPYAQLNLTDSSLHSSLCTNGMLSKCVIFTSNFNGRDAMSLCICSSHVMIFITTSFLNTLGETINPIYFSI